MRPFCLRNPTGEQLHLPRQFGGGSIQRTDRRAQPGVLNPGTLLERPPVRTQIFRCCCDLFVHGGGGVIAILAGVAVIVVVVPFAGAVPVVVVVVAILFFALSMFHYVRGRKPENNRTTTPTYKYPKISSDT